MELVDVSFDDVANVVAAPASKAIETAIKTAEIACIAFGRHGMLLNFRAMRARVTNGLLAI